MKLPMNMEDAKGLATVLSNYKDDYFFTVVLAFFYTYILYPSNHLQINSKRPTYFGNKNKMNHTRENLDDYFS